MSNTEKQKTWERTKTPGLLRHKGGRYYGRFSIAGKEKFVPLETDLMEVAKRRFAEHKARYARTRKAAAATKQGNASMGDLLTLYRDRVKARADIGERTRRVYLEHCDFIGKTWPGFAALRPDEITKTSVAAWKDRALSQGTGFRPPGAKSETVATLGRSAGRFNKAVDVLRKLLDIAVEVGALHGNVLLGRGIKAKDEPRKPKLPEAGELAKVFDEIERGGGVAGWGREAADFCRFVTFTGCRKGEAAAVTWGDVDEVRGVLRVNGTKTAAAAREVPLSRAAREVLAKVRARRETADRTGREDVPRYAPEARVLAVAEAQRSLDRACKVVGVPRLTHHDLRDAFATACIEAGVDIPTVAAWLGHADGGALLMRVYAHHRRAHSVAQMEKVNF